VSTALRAAAAFLLGFALPVLASESSLERLAGPARALHARVNQVRRERNLIPLVVDSEVARIAQAHADDMAAHGYVSHTDRAGRNPLERAQASGLSGFRLLAENIGASSVSGDRVASVVEEWLRSPSHRENLLTPAFRVTGIGVAERPDGTTLLVQLYVGR
jgi:uncharacterized protein YkwD